MQVLTPGHWYIAQNMEDPAAGQPIQFIEKKPSDGSSVPVGSLVTVHDGTTNEEVLNILIDRLTFLQNKTPCTENDCAITHLQEALHWLEARTKQRLKRGVEGTYLA